MYYIIYIKILENLFNNSAEIDLSDDSNDSNQSAEDFVLNEINNN